MFQAELVVRHTVFVKTNLLASKQCRFVATIVACARLWLQSYAYFQIYQIQLLLLQCLSIRAALGQQFQYMP